MYMNSNHDWVLLLHSTCLFLLLLHFFFFIFLCIYKICMYIGKMNTYFQLVNRDMRQGFDVEDKNIHFQIEIFFITNISFLTLTNNTLPTSVKPANYRIVWISPVYSDLFNSIKNKNKEIFLEYLVYIYRKDNRSRLFSSTI